MKSVFQTLLPATLLVLSGWLQAFASGAVAKRLRRASRLHAPNPPQVAGGLAAGAAASGGSLPAVNSTDFARQYALFTQELAAVAAAGEALRRNLSSSANSSNGLQANRPPRVYFLFLAVDKVSNLDVWRAFFANAPSYQYRAYVHCKLPSCNIAVQNSPLVAVSTVPSYYCTDLVSPMMQLIAAALRGDNDGRNPADKFAFISDSSLPAKPFSQIYATLTVRRGSDFCVFPSAEWADIPSIGGGLEFALKHHQWLTLERSHAEQAWMLWSSGTLHDFMRRYSMNMHPMVGGGNMFGDGRNFGCLDEFWHMLALYGAFSHTKRSVSLPQFSAGSLDISSNAGWQGTCDTFVMWSKYIHTPGWNPFLALHSALDGFSLPHPGNLARPGWWDSISTRGISTIRNSEFLFVRKFIDGPALADGASFSQAYTRIVLG